MKDHKIYENEIKSLKDIVNDHTAVDEVISKGKVRELLKLMDQHDMLRYLMYKTVRGPMYEMSSESEKIMIQKGIVEGMNWWLEDQVWKLNEESEDTEISK